MTDLIPTYDGIPTASLLQAARYAAWRLPPLINRLERIEGYPSTEFEFAGHLPSSPEREGLEDGARQLLRFLATGQIIAGGCPMRLEGHRIRLMHRVKGLPSETLYLFDPATGLPEAESFSEIGNPFVNVPIPSHSWDIDRIDWLSGFIWHGYLSDELTENKLVEVVAYAYIGIKIDDLRNAFEPDEVLSIPDSSPTAAPDYRSPFVELMLRAEKHFGEHLLTAKKDEIEEWLFAEGPKIDRHWSRNKARMMATFLRHPNMQKGGNKKV